MKHEWKKHEKHIYLPKAKPEYIEIPAMQYLTLSGEGNPNSETFGKQIEALYTLTYAIKMLPRKGYDIKNYVEYTIYPLEGIWDLNVAGRMKEQLDKEDLVYTIMIRQPDFITQDTMQLALDQVKKTKTNPFLPHIKLERITDGECVQMLHIGSYDDEPASFQAIEAFMQANGLSRSTKIHREIYLSDPRRTAPEKRNTVLRCFVQKIG